MDLATFLSALLAIIVFDLVLAGDNAIVIALAARGLPAHLQRRAILWGTAGAVSVPASPAPSVGRTTSLGSASEMPTARRTLGELTASRTAEGSISPSWNHPGEIGVNPAPSLKIDGPVEPRVKSAHAGLGDGTASESGTSKC